MELSISMTYVAMRAETEKHVARKSALSKEFLLLGILKLSEVCADEFVKSSRHKEEVDEDIRAVKKLLDENSIDSRRVRRLLRQVAASEDSVISSESEMFKCLAEAGMAAKERNVSEIWAQDVLQVILKSPTDAILQVCPLKDVGTRDADNAEENSAAKAEEMTRDFLPELTARIRRMRARLLNTVHGQDHVVHAFAEGIFGAEVLAASDEKRKAPRAIFVFAGPPGVGKTFLAEQAAEALSIPYKRFDMSSYADHQAYMELIGFEKSYQEAKPGTLTEFVRKEPHCILLFDEIEKAHLNTIQLFLQILDAGRLADRYHGKDVFFKDTIIIFTSNAGKTLYGNDTKLNLAGISRKTLINALETEVNPQTGRPFFPAAITSRMATGYPLLFNHLQPHHLESICAGELKRVGELFEKQYEISVDFDPLVSTALLYREGGCADARTLRAQTELFVKSEVFKVCRLFNEEHFGESLKELQRIRFSVGTLNADAEPLFFCNEKPEILIYGSASFARQCRTELEEYTIYDTQSVEKTLDIAGTKDIRLVLLDVAAPSESDLSVFSPMMETVLEYNHTLTNSANAFDFAPIGARLLHDGKQLFHALRERLPDIPIYLLETDKFCLDTELVMSFVRAGARGKLEAPTDADGFSVFEDQLSAICMELYMQNVAAKMAAEHKILSFETAPKLLDGKREISISLRDFSLSRAPDANDSGSVLEDVDKPNIRFADVIGAEDAKQELNFFIDYLKNPKSFSAKGLKPPKGVLLYGPPGTGKTMLAKALAGESDVAFIPAVASSFVTKYQGSGPESVRELFQKARRYAPSIVFIDEIDAIGRKRGQSNTAHGEEMALNALLTEMDGFSVDPKRPVFVLAATNFDVEEGQGGVGVMDPALLRRFDRRILVDLPNEAEREQYIRMCLTNIKMHTVSEQMIKRLASRSMGMSPANLAAVFELAIRMASKANTNLNDTVLDEAFEITKHGEKKDWGFEYLERVARHESGHALLCYLGGYTPSYLTIIARGDHGGYMEHSSQEMNPLSTKEELLNRIRTSLGGRAAEIVYYGEKNGVSTGASGDLESATRIAQAMICSYGMDNHFGLAVMNQQQALQSEMVQRRVNEILSEEFNKTVETIQANRAKIDRLVDELMKKNKLTGEEMEDLLREE